MDWRQKNIHEIFDGNVEQFEEAYAFAVAEGRHYAIRWQDIADAATTLPKLKIEAQNLIERRLGYLPDDGVVLAYEPYIRALIQNHCQGTLTDEAFSEQAEEHIKLIRQADLNHNTNLTYDARIYQNYETYLSHYGQAVKNRLTRFLGYEPKLEHSLIAELWLREVMSRDLFQLPSQITAADYKAITLIKYREVLLEQGQPAADSSPLFGLEPVLL